MGEKYKDRWYDFLPWVLLNKRVAFQRRLGTSPSMLVMGFNPAIPGDLLRDPGQDLDQSELEELLQHMSEVDNTPPKPTTIPKQLPVEDPPDDVTHVYAKEHKTTGLQAPFTGPYPVVARPTRTTVKIRVGHNIRGQPRYQIRHWRDLKIFKAPAEVQEAERPKLGRPPRQGHSPSAIQDQVKPSTITRSEAPSDTSTELEKPNRPIRSSRNANPIYVDSVATRGPPPHLGFPVVPKIWSASSAELEMINRSIGG